MKQKTINKAKRIETLASDIKELLHLDECKPVLLQGELWLRMKSGEVSLDCPVGLKPLLDKKNDNTKAIKLAIIQLWIVNLEWEQSAIAGMVLNG